MPRSFAPHKTVEKKIENIFLPILEASTKLCNIYAKQFRKHFRSKSFDTRSLSYPNNQSEHSKMSKQHSQCSCKFNFCSLQSRNVLSNGQKKGQKKKLSTLQSTLQSKKGDHPILHEIRCNCANVNFQAVAYYQKNFSSLYKEMNNMRCMLQILQKIQG